MLIGYEANIGLNPREALKNFSGQQKKGPSFLGPNNILKAGLSI
jgi:hypothetical protein